MTREKERELLVALMKSGSQEGGGKSGKENQSTSNSRLRLRRKGSSFFFFPVQFNYQMFFDVSEAA
jgi:hypothetical protein